jgi:methyltransferase
MRLLTIWAAVFGLMLIEARRAAANERAQRLRGGIEPHDDVYKMMRIAYPAAFLAMLAEGRLRDGSGAGFVAAGVIFFAAAKALKWWAIVTLGPCWTFRVIVVPGLKLVESGPYRWVRHPNYLAVVGELLGAALMADAPVAGTVSVVVFIGLLTKRISVESRMLTAARRPPPASNIPGGTSDHVQPAVPGLHLTRPSRSRPL